jgi:hypothetical protein
MFGGATYIGIPPYLSLIFFSTYFLIYRPIAFPLDNATINPSNIRIKMYLTTYKLACVRVSEIQAVTNAAAEASISLLLVRPLARRNMIPVP